MDEHYTHGLPPSDTIPHSDAQTLNEDLDMIEDTFEWETEEDEDEGFEVMRRKPWLLEEPVLWTKDFIIINIGIWLGIIIGAVIIWDGWSRANRHWYCRVTGSFEMTTADEANLFVNDFGLNIMPTLQDEDLMITHGATINLGKDCTAKNRTHCSARTDTSNGTVVPPVKSARLSTRKKKYITYGRVDVVAKLPAGDWLWPAIYMMPMGSSYGPWPASGEIDIAESRGNNRTYPGGGNNIISSSLHFGPDAEHDVWYDNYERRSLKRKTFSEDFNTFSVEWSQKYIFTFINSKVKQVLYRPLTTSSWDKGNFASARDKNNMTLRNPWRNAFANAPFDKPFCLALGVSVGSTNSYFKDHKGGKPWSDDSPSAPKEFWDARDTWLPTWTQPAMQVKKVGMYQQCDGDEQDWWVPNSVINAE
ncbi:hypothetical protein N0V93_009478 [Gnomoniopsis smithogilvyi]|uniref:GH16 domain-containing protein n=1 Tax=Gnomoniopsis smithogilvyi TaxID=1191159 RepID=A0A9W8YJQ0_9PEZI|nr:hypothetical protein N0V93_009478 [Gnomoniopsis smithogilvyi]